ncbi:hypothetical protein ACQY0O_006302 [Thecaphora frezii]
MPSSRKKWTGTTRFGSPPLQPQPLLVRNVALLPVTLTHLPTDATFIHPLRSDVAALVHRFVHAWSSRTARTPGFNAPSTSTSPAAAHTQAPPSPFDAFVECWIQHGWDYVHLAYGDHPDTQARFCESIARVFFEHLAPLAQVQAHTLLVAEPPAKLPTRQALEATAAVFGLYLLWETQVYPESGVGVAHSRRPMETVQIEHDIYRFLLRLPHLCSDALDAYPPSACQADAADDATPPPAADLVFVLRRLFGIGEESDNATPQEPNAGSSRAAKRATSKQQAATKVKKGNKAAPAHTPKRAQWSTRIEAATSSFAAKGQEGNPIFDIVPPSRFATRMPRTFPSSRLMPKMQADRTFHRLARAIAVRYEPEPEPEAEQGQGGGSTSSADEAPSSRSGRAMAEQAESEGEQEERGKGQEEGDIEASLERPNKKRNIASRRILCGLSRSDLIRLRARERIDLDPCAVVDPARVYEGEEIKVELPSWIASNKSTSRLKPWLDHSSGPLESALCRFTEEKQAYHRARSALLAGEAVGERIRDVGEGEEEGEHAATGAGEVGREERDEQVIKDHPAHLLRRFAPDGTGTDEEELEELGEEDNDVEVDVNSTSPLSLADLYRLAAKRTGEAIAAASQQVAHCTAP